MSLSDETINAGDIDVQLNEKNIIVPKINYEELLKGQTCDGPAYLKVNKKNNIVFNNDKKKKDNDGCFYCVVLSDDDNDDNCLCDSLNCFSECVCNFVCCFLNGLNDDD